jgi:hypothetical protein
MAELVVKPNEKIEPLPTYLGSSIRFIAAIVLIARFQHESNVPSKNRLIKDRINCVNAMLRNHGSEHRLLIDPRCKQVIKDLEQACWKADPHGNALCEPTRAIAVGYWIARQFPMRGAAGRAGRSFDYLTAAST